MRPDAAAVLERWVDAINSHDVVGLTELMTPDFVMVDSLGQRVERAAMEQGWRGYFALCPDYRVRTEVMMSDDDTFLIAGEAGGTIDGRAWNIPAAWKAVIRHGRICEWRIFADNKPVYDILSARQSV